MKFRHLPLLTFAVLTTLTLSAEQRPVWERTTQRIQKEVRHELLMLPYVNAFDNVAYKVEGYKVTLIGQVTNPAVKIDAENVVKSMRVSNKLTIRSKCCRPFPATTTCAELYSALSTAIRRWRSMPSA